MIEQDRLYFQHRAEEELQRAQRATAPEANVAHHQLAEAYFDQLVIPEHITAAKQPGQGGNL